MKNKVTYAEVARKFAEYKIKECGKRPTREELAQIREAYTKGLFNGTKVVGKKNTTIAEVKSSEEFRNVLASYREWKSKKQNMRAVSLQEKNILARKLLLKENQKSDDIKGDLEKNFVYGIDKQKKPTCLEENTVYDVNRKSVIGSLNKSIREANHAIYRARKALRENDFDMAQDSTQQAVDAVDNAQQALDATPTSQIDPSIVETVQNLKAVIDTLVTQCGIEPQTDFGPNPNADVPATTGVPAEVPTDSNTPQMSESMKNLKSRIATRNRLFKAIKEANSGKLGYSSNTNAGINMVMSGVKAVQDSIKKESEEVDHPVNTTNPPSQLTMPTKNELFNGSKEAGKRWPTEKVNLKHGLNESIADKMIDKRIKEMQESMNFQEILNAGVLG